MNNAPLILAVAALITAIGGFCAVFMKLATIHILINSGFAKYLKVATDAAEARGNLAGAKKRKRRKRVN